MEKRPLTPIEKLLFATCSTAILLIFISSDPVGCINSLSRLIDMVR
jgi:hypothetical protein